MTQVKGVTLVIEGRRFVQESPTFEQDMYIMEQAIAAGVDQAVLAMTPDENDLEPAVKQLLIRAYKSGALFKLMAALVTEEGVEWTPAQSEKNAEFFRTVRDPESKAQLHPALVGALMAFFESGASLKQISSISSETRKPSVAPEPQRKRGVRPGLSPEAAGALFGSAHTTHVSGKSPSTKRRNPKTSSP